MGASRPVAEIYARRFDTSQKAIESYSSHLGLLDDYNQIKDIDKGSTLFAEVLNKGGKVCLISDADCDGQSASNIMSRFAQETGWRNRLIILTPNRLTDGYGANPEIVDIAVLNDADLIITADNGIMAFDAAERAKKLEVPYIVTDHHQPGEKLPVAFAVINPARKDCNYKSGILCGASVLYMLLLATQKKILCTHGMFPNACNMYRLLQILAFATIADCVPLRGANRALVNEGLKVMGSDPYPSFLAYMKAKGVTSESINVETVSFGLGPICNSVARLGPAGPSIDFLCSDDNSEIIKLMGDMNNANDERRKIQTEVLEEADADAAVFLTDRPDAKIIVVGQKKWHHGVVGIVAGRLAEKYRVPVIVFGGSQQDDSILKGSGRAGESDLHLKELIDDVYKFMPDAILGYGGHAKAMGMSLIAEALPIMASQAELSATEMGEEGKAPIIVDEICDEKFDTFRTFEWLKAGPFGQGFPEPSILVKNAIITEFRAASSNTAIFKICGIKCIGFNMAERLKDTNKANLIVSPRISHFRGRRSEELVVKGIV